MIEDLVPEVRGAIGVSASFDDEKIPNLIKRACNRLLRDYHFPKAVKKQDFTNLFLNSKEFTLPAGFKKELEFRFYDPTTVSWSDPLVKRERFQLPYPSGAPHYYWLEGTKLVIDTAISVGMVGWTGTLYYESMDVDINEDWLTADFEEAVRLLSVVRGAAEFRKSEVMQTYAPLWADEQASLAIYLNELEWNNADIRMNEARQPVGERYPV